MRRPHIADRRNGTSLARPRLFSPDLTGRKNPHKCEVIERHPNNFAEHNRPSARSRRGALWRFGLLFISEISCSTCVGKQNRHVVVRESRGLQIVGNRDGS
jgi:hypothetical protein